MCPYECDAFLLFPMHHPFVSW